MDIHRLVEKYQLSPSERLVLERLQEYVEQGKSNPTIRQLAKETYLSTASIVAMCKKMGLSGYSELMYYMFASKNLTFNFTHHYPIDEFSEVFSNIVLQHVNDYWSFIGVGLSRNIANYMSEYANLKGFMATSNAYLEYIRPNHVQQSLIFFTSNSGETSLILDYAKRAKTNGADIISFVGDGQSTLAKLSTLSIPTQTFSAYSFQEYYPQLFFGNALNLFELLMSRALIKIDHSSPS